MLGITGLVIGAASHRLGLLLGGLLVFFDAVLAAEAGSDDDVVL